MKVIQINNLCNKGSTGRIAAGISSLAEKYNISNRIIYFSQETTMKNAIKITNKIYIKLQALKSRVLGNYGFNSTHATRKLIKVIKKYNPDIVHIHNIHAHNVNFELLFAFLKKESKKVIYTFHDCWAFTGYCPHFAMVKCDKWKATCNHCPLKKEYSWFFDKSKKNFVRKKMALSGLDLTIVTPSKWLANLVKCSFLKDFPIKVINNGIDLTVFHPIDSSFKEDMKLTGKKILLGVADRWDKRKGLDVFIELSRRFGENYQIVLVGTNEAIDKTLPNNILSIHKTQNQQELASIYSSADLLINPTREEVFGLVNIESLACGTPVVTFNSGGSPECVDSTCGSVVDCDDVDALEDEIIRICTTAPYSKEACIKRAKQFNMYEKFKDYIDLYSE